MGFLKKLLKVLIVLFVIVILVFGYLGFVPGVSNIFGSNKPKNLGIQYTDADLKSIVSKNTISRIVVNSAPDIKSSFVLEGSQPINNVFTDKELTARLNQTSDWALNPFTNVHIKIGNDGTVEASGIVRVDRLRSYAEATGVPTKDIKAISQIMDKYKIPRVSFPAYVKGNLSIINDKLDINLSELNIGKIPISKEIFSQAKTPFEDFVHERLTSGGYGSLYIKSLTFSNGKMNFSGNIPKVITTAKTILNNK
jgi:hypothetical protein